MHIAKKMTIHEFGTEHNDTILMFHPLGVWWDIFEYVIPTLEKEYHLVIPAMPGLDPDRPESTYTSVEDIASEAAKLLIERGQKRIACLFGCSMGGGVVTRMLAEQKIEADCAVIDGGITPYQLPKPLTYLIGVRDWCMLMIGKHASLKALRRMVDPEKFSDDDVAYIRKVFASMSSKTIWRAFYSCNNYSMPQPVPQPPCPVQYRYGEAEKKARAWDIAYIKKTFPTTEFVEVPGQGHGESFTLHPEQFCKDLSGFIKKSKGVK
ncbi:alpha/beta hydrolase [Treponema sp. HNW]|uniref:alpha/beta fold hydrolase n=1 Tax=Treponema sp. HNW TaxID=3116654 RepID=UPI003D138C12